MTEKPATNVSKPQGQPCPRCNTTGVCSDCHGTGHTECIACKGKGTVTSPSGKTHPCKICQGTGKISCPPLCPSCSGLGVILPKYQAEIAEKYRTPTAKFQPVTTAVRWLVVACIVAYIVAPRDFPSLLPQPLPRLFWDIMVNQPNSLYNGEYWRFITPAFLHGGIFHLIMNMYVLWSAGPNIEGILGSRRFLILYFAGALLGNILSWAFNPYPGIGASTAIFAVMSAYVGLHWRWGFFSASMIREIVWLLAIFLAIGFLLGDIVNLDNWGHLGGLLAGLIVSTIGPRPHN